MRLTEVCGALGCMAEAACAQACFGLQRWVGVGTIQLPHGELVGSKDTPAGCTLCSFPMAMEIWDFMEQNVQLLCPET